MDFGEDFAATRVDGAEPLRVGRGDRLPADHASEAARFQKLYHFGQEIDASRGCHDDSSADSSTCTDYHTSG